MSPAQQLLTQATFVLIGPMKGYPDLDLWEYTVDYAPSETIHAAIPRTPDADVGYAIRAIYHAGAARQQALIAYHHGVFQNSLKPFPAVPTQPDPLPSAPTPP